MRQAGAMSVRGIVLAAGRGVRMGGTPKQLLLLDGRPLLQHVIDTAAAAGLEDIVVVLGHEADRIAPALHLPPGARVVVNPHHEEGQATSLTRRPGRDAAGGHRRARAARRPARGAGRRAPGRDRRGGGRRRSCGRPTAGFRVIRSLLARSLWAELARRGDRAPAA